MTIVVSTIAILVTVFIGHDGDDDDDDDDGHSPHHRRRTMASWHLAPRLTETFRRWRLGSGDVSLTVSTWTSGMSQAKSPKEASEIKQVIIGIIMMINIRIFCIDIMY